MGRWDRRESVLARHAGHGLLGVDERCVICVDCSTTLLLDVNREATYTPPAHAPLRLDEPIKDKYGRKQCTRCGKRVQYDSDGDPGPHARADDPFRPCVRVGEKHAVLPPGGWRELAAQLAAADAAEAAEASS